MRLLILLTLLFAGASCRYHGYDFEDEGDMVWKEDDHLDTVKPLEEVKDVEVGDGMEEEIFEDPAAGYGYYKPNRMRDCYYKCGRKMGPCEEGCGPGQYCCRRGMPSSKLCPKAMRKVANYKRYTCIAKLETLWRDDGRCGNSYARLPDGRRAQCNPNGEHPCCSDSNRCGNTDAHCKCSGCTDYRAQEETEKPKEDTEKPKEETV